MFEVTTMLFRPSTRRCPRPSARRLRVELLEDRWLPSTLTFTAPSGNGLDDMLLRRDGDKIELYDNGALVKALKNVTAVQITGASGEDNRLTVDYSLGGLFSVPITFTNAAGDSGTDTLVVKGTTGADAFTFAAGQVSVQNGSTISYTGVEQVNVNGLAGNDTFTVNGFTPGTALSVDGGTGTNTLTVNGLAGNDAFAIATGQVTVNGSTVSFANVQLVQVNGLAGDDTITVNGFTPGTTLSVDGGPGTNTLTVSGPGGTNSINITTGQVTVDSSVINFTGFNALNVNANGVADTVTMTGTNPTTDTTVTAIVGAGDSFALNLTGTDFVGNLTVLHFAHATVLVKKNSSGQGGNFAGHLRVHGSGTIDGATIDGDVSGTLMSEVMTNVLIMGSVTATADLSAQGSGTMDGVTVDGDVSGTLMSEAMSNIMIMGSVTATAVLSSTGSGTMDGVTVGGDVSGTLISEEMSNIMIMGSLSGSATAMQTPDSTGSVNGTFSVGGNLSGTVQVDGTLSQLSVGGSTADGSISAGSIGTVLATNATAGSPVLTIKEAGVTRKLIATRADNGQPTPTSVVFDYVYQGSTGSGSNPQLTVKVTNGNPTTSAVPFDLSLTSTSAAAGFDLARLFANGTSDVRDVAVEGNILPTVVSAAALAHFNLPANTPGGVLLPLDNLGSVAAQNNVVAGTVQAKSVMAVAFGSITQNGVTPGASATNTNAAALLAPGTATVQANDTFLVPFAESQTVALFLVTGSSGFNAKDVLFTDQIADNTSVTAVVSTVAGAITSIQFLGDGGSIQTALPVGSIKSTGPLGDLLLSSSSGIRDVTAPSIFGNMIIGGPILGTVQTTGQRTDPMTGAVSQVPADLGSALTDGSGTIVGTTSITATAIPGRVISRNNLISQITTGDFNVIAAQGDIGVAYVNAMGQLVRFGGISAHSPTGSVVALGNMFGDFNSNGGFAARIAVKGRPIPGLDPGRIGILGGVNVSVGGMRSGSDIVSGGVIGDPAGGTFLSINGAIKGIVAAEGKIKFAVSGNMGSSIFENATGKDAAAIDAIFTYNNKQPLAFDLTGLDLAGLGLILDDLKALTVGKDGHLTGPVA
jgi:hypothetical protein